MIMLTIVACGGSGSRMAPVTKFLNKHLIPTGDGLMVDHPLEFLRRHDIKNVTIVTGSNHASQVVDYIQDGDKYGFDKVSYAFQPEPKGIADIFKRVSINDRAPIGVLLILGDNYFSEKQLAIDLDCPHPHYAYAFEYALGDKEKAKSFGQVIYDDDGPVEIIEKPSSPQHDRILTGLYYFPGDVFARVEELSPSERGELEITDVLKMYLKKDRLRVVQIKGEWADLGEKNSWIDFVASQGARDGQD